MGLREDHEIRLHQEQLERHDERTIAMMTACIYSAVAKDVIPKDIEVKARLMAQAVLDAAELWNKVQIHVAYEKAVGGSLENAVGGTEEKSA